MLTVIIYRYKFMISFSKRSILSISCIQFSPKNLPVKVCGESSFVGTRSSYIYAVPMAYYMRYRFTLQCNISRVYECTLISTLSRISRRIIWQPEHRHAFFDYTKYRLYPKWEYPVMKYLAGGTQQIMLPQSDSADFRLALVPFTFISSDS